MKISEALKIIGCPRSTLYYAIKKGQIRSLKDGLGRNNLNKDDVLAYADNYNGISGISKSKDKRIKECVLGILECLGQDTKSPDLIDTPRRVSKMLQEQVSREMFKLTTFEKREKYSQMIISGPIKFYSLCAHHMLPFFGEAWVAYIPGERIVGLSKLARTVDFFSKGLNTQEFMTQEIAKFIHEQLEPEGVGVIMRATHMCQAMRGIKSHSDMITSEILGSFLNESTRSEFLRLAGF